MHSSSSNPLVRLPKSNSAIVSGINKLPESPAIEGVDLEELPMGAVLEIETGHTTYHLENKGEGQALLSGHPKYCPQPTAVSIQGSLGPDGGLKWHFLGIGMKMVFLPPEHGVVRTSSIKALRRVTPQGSN
jgi:hypothetical protein